MSLFTRIFPILGLTALLAAPAPALAQGERSIYASVLDRRGAPVTTLTAADFVVREDGAAREVLRAVPADDPLQIAILVDTSQAVERHVSNVRRALTRFVRELAGEHDLALLEFGERSTIVTNYTSDPAKLEAGIGRLFARPGSGAYALDAIVDASKRLRRREGARNVIVVITTEGPEFSERYHGAVLDEFRTSATLHAFVLTRPGGSPALHDPARRERELTLASGTSETGGRREHLLTSLSLEERLHELAVELEHQYRVEYARPASLVPPSKVEVSVRQAGLVVRAPKVPLTGNVGS